MEKWNDIWPIFPFLCRPLSMGTCYSSARMEEEGRESVVGKCVATLHALFLRCLQSPRFIMFRLIWLFNLSHLEFNAPVIVNSCWKKVVEWNSSSSSWLLYLNYSDIMYRERSSLCIYSRIYLSFRQLDLF